MGSNALNDGKMREGRNERGGEWSEAKLSLSFLQFESDSNASASQLHSTAHKISGCVFS